MEVLGGVTVIELIVGLGTATTEVPATAPSAALIKAFPAATPVAKPLLLIVAAAVLVDDQSTKLLTSIVEPSE